MLLFFNFSENINIHMHSLLAACSQLSSVCSNYFVPLVILGGIILGGYAIVRFPLLRKTFLPGSLIGGLILLLLGPQVLGSSHPDWQLPISYYQLWSTLPGVLINVVFACLFLARPILPFRHMWRAAGPQVAFGQSLAWGQYAVGGLLTLAVLIPVFGVSPLTGALIEISFEGGHGTVSGMSSIFDQLGFHQGKDLAMGLATVSLISALVSGMILVYWGRKRHHLKEVHHQAAVDRAYHRRILYDLRKQGIQLREHLTPSRVCNHVILISVAVLIGWLIWQALIITERLTWGHHFGTDLISHVPFFPLCMFGGMIAHVIWRRLGISTSRPLIELVSAVALSALIATAIGTMSLDYLIHHLGVFLLLAATGVCWILFVFLVFARRIFRVHWFQNGIVNVGQSMGMTATGLLLLHIVDPHDKTSSLESFGYKQLMFEPFVGGGLVTALSMPLIVAIGLPAFTLISAGICVGCLTLGVLNFGPARHHKQSKAAAASTMSGSH